MQSPRDDLTRTTLSVLFTGALIGGTLWVMWPFLPAIVWAATLVITTWPFMLQVQRYTGNRRGIAVLIMTLGLLLTLIVPLWLAITTVFDNLDRIADWGRAAAAMHLPPPPEWLADIPLIGTRLAQAWSQIAAMRASDLAPQLRPYIGDLTRWFAAAAGGAGLLLVQLLLTVAIAGVLYAQGERAATEVIRFGRRLGGERGETAVRLVGQAIRGVALGVVVTAIAQSLLGGIGLAVVGVPYAAVLSALMFVLCLSQLGPGFVLIPAIAWMYWSGEPIWATVLVIFTVVAMAMDNFLRPVLIRRGADLPILLIIAGVIGGLIAYGLLGIFLGPAVLAVAYTLLNAWIDEDDPAVGEASSSTAPERHPLGPPN
jgi:predicted PurR-regulated permease PerM